MPGRPRYYLDLDRAHLLHNLGNTYEEIALAMGVDHKTLYRQFVEAARNDSCASLYRVENVQ
jgi:hypothetical protein